MFISISFPLKTNAPISSVGIPELGIVVQIFRKIPEIKENNQKLRLLPEVYALVID
uniref:hypothetical protein n=1 Tax=Ornithobacterium rhinotracheale TaxID=28251 RepID=UPI00129CAD8F|nr:hypothetical protein [Ornithobacterium rhinotracheale]